MWRERSLETAKLAKVVTSSAATPDEKGAALLRLDLFDQHPDPVSLYPDAFLNNTGDGPRPPHKSTFWTSLQDALRHHGTFIQLGYTSLSYIRDNSGTDTTQLKMIYSIDLMNAVQIPVDYEDSRTIRQHAQKCALTSISGVIINNGRNLTRLYLHCDVGEWVVPQNKRTQMSRDSLGRSERLRADDDGEESVGSFQLTISSDKKRKELL
ncbi:unnamed protein product [Agarophyton chilense]